jgi:hypothetical protein
MSVAVWTTGKAVRSAFPAILLVFSLLSVGCSTSVTRRSALMEKPHDEVKGKMQMSPEQLAIHVRALGNRSSGIIEEAADRVITESTDAGVSREALLWKINAIPAVYRATYHSDPALALLDIMAFSFQMLQYFEEGPGREAFGQWQPIAVEAARSLNRDVFELSERLVPPGEKRPAEEEVRAWVRKHPIENHLFVRDSVATLYVDLVTQPEMGTIAAMSQLPYDVGDISEQLTAYTEYLPKQAQWQVELLISDNVPEEEIEYLLNEISAATASLDRVTSVVEKGPEIITRERLAVLKAVREERVALLESIEAQRIATLKWLNEEMNSTVTRGTEQLFSRAEDLIDHIFIRMAQLLGGVFLVCLIVGIPFILGVVRRK